MVNSNVILQDELNTVDWLAVVCDEVQVIKVGNASRTAHRTNEICVCLLPKRSHAKSFHYITIRYWQNATYVYGLLS